MDFSKNLVFKWVVVLFIRTTISLNINGFCYIIGYFWILLDIFGYFLKLLVFLGIFEYFWGYFEYFKVF